MKRTTNAYALCVLALPGLLSQGCGKRRESAPKAIAPLSKPAPEIVRTQRIAPRRLRPRLITGTARMTKDRSFVVLFRAKDDAGKTIFARKVFRKNHPRYPLLVKIFGKLKPGQSRTLTTPTPMPQRSELATITLPSP
jgi:hypothetical protein